MLLTKNRIGGVLILAFCVAYAVLSQKIVLLPFQAKSAFHARTLPEILSVLGIGLSMLVIILPGSRDKPDFRGYKWLTGLAFLILMSAYGMTIRPLGFILSTSAFLMIGFALLGERNPVRLVVVAVPLVLGFWFLMSEGLNVYVEPLPWFLKG